MSSSFVAGTAVDLTATEVAGSTFDDWAGCDSTNGNMCTVNMDRDRVITAEFTDPSACGATTIHQTDSSSCPDLRTILSIQDDQGQPVAGLVETNFICSAGDACLDEGGSAHPIQLETDGSLAVGLVIDKSGSLSTTDLANIRQACNDFFALLVPGDSVAV